MVGGRNDWVGDWADSCNWLNGGMRGDMGRGEGEGEGDLGWYLTKILREMVPRETGDHRLPARCEQGLGGNEEGGLGGWKG